MKQLSAPRELVHRPQQARSTQTQERLLGALESLLEERFFEQISIRDIAERAEVSPATIYRRFANKEALLPVLYQRFDTRLRQWAGAVWSADRLQAYPDLGSRVRWLVGEHVEFYARNAAILRTLYLYSRINGELTLPDLEASRSSVYRELLLPLLDGEHNGTSTIDDLKARCVIQILISAVNERILFATFKPSSLLRLGKTDFVQELSQMLTCYLHQGERSA